MQHCYLSRIAHVTSRHRDRFSQIVGSFPTKHRRYVRILSAGSDYFAGMLSSVLAPIPHKEWMSSVISIATAVHFDIARIIGKLPFVLVTKNIGVAGLRQQPVKEFDVTRVKTMIEVVVARMMKNEHAAFLQQRFVSIEIEVIAERHHLHEQRVQNRIDVIW